MRSDLVERYERALEERLRLLHKLAEAAGWAAECIETSHADHLQSALLSTQDAIAGYAYNVAELRRLEEEGRGE